MTPRGRRGVTVPTDYVLLVGITALLASGLLLGTGGFVVDQQERAVRSGLTVVGNDLAADLTTADRLAGSLDGPGSVELDTELPETVAGTTYTVTVQHVAGTQYEIVLTSTDPAVTVSVPVRTFRNVSADSIDGGGVTIRADSTTMEVRDA